ncbi:MAG: hypothetical protein J6A79_03545 [Clostridia bacterium]|nr:hypothetical protein [Clostridia bacterium]
MPEDRIIDLKHVVGVYPLTNTGAVLVHRIDYPNEKVQASINGIDPSWCDLIEQYMETTGEMELGFNLGAFFVPFCDVQRFYK